MEKDFEDKMFNKCFQNQTAILFNEEKRKIDEYADKIENCHEVRIKKCLEYLGEKWEKLSIYKNDTFNMIVSFKVVNDYLILIKFVLKKLNFCIDFMKIYIE